jgi:AraC-like DNA-binding protein
MIDLCGCKVMAAKRIAQPWSHRQKFYRFYQRTAFRGYPQYREYSLKNFKAASTRHRQGRPCAPSGTLPYEIGFDNPAHFPRVFRARVGEAPAAWRRMRVEQG